MKNKNWKHKNCWPKSPNLNHQWVSYSKGCMTDHWTSMHTIIRIACFLLLIVGIALTNQTMIMIIFFLLLGLLKTHCTLATVFPLLKRLRWLILTLFILHLSFDSPTPNELLPNLTGLLLAFEKVAGLITMVFAAHLLLCTTSTHQIIAALQWWLTPFNKIGFSTQKLAVRLALVLETVTEIQNLYTETTPTTTNPINKITDRITKLLTQTLTHAETTPLRTLEIPRLQAPPLWQWNYPLLLTLLIWLGPWE